MSDKFQSQEHSERGNQLNAAGDTAGAIAEWQAAIALDPNNWQAHNNLADAYTASGKYDLAEKECRALVRQRSSDWRSHSKLADLLEKRKDYVNAAAEYREALQLESDRTTRRKLVRILMRLGDVHEAEIEFGRIQDAEEEDSWSSWRNPREEHRIIFAVIVLALIFIKQWFPFVGDWFGQIVKFFQGLGGK
jgi:tetratricopeptide (TPR) repeat protein